MGIGPAEARDLGYWEYAALLHGWNARHGGDGASDGRPDAAPPPDDGFVRARQAGLAARGIATA
jgi:hypothetical protein